MLYYCPPTGEIVDFSQILRRNFGIFARPVHVVNCMALKSAKKRTAPTKQ